MSNENNKMQVDIENLFKQNVNDLSSIKELYSKLEELGEKITQVKYIDITIVKKLKKEYEKLKKIILDENVQAKLTNDIETIKSHLDTIATYKNSVNILEIGAKSSNVIFNELTNKYDMFDISDYLKLALEKGYNDIILPSGNYLIESSIPIYDGITIRGYNATIYSSPSNKVKTLFAIKGSNNKIEGINFNSAKKYKVTINSSDVTAISSNICAISIEGENDKSYNNLVQNCGASNVCYFTSIMNTSNAYINNCNVDESYFPIYTGFGAENVYINNCTLITQEDTDKYGHNIYIGNASNNINVNNCKLINNGQESSNIIKCGTNDGEATNININNCEITGKVKSSLFYVHNDTDLTLNNCSVNVDSVGGYARVLQFNNSSKFVAKNCYFCLNSFDRFTVNYELTNAVIKFINSSFVVKNTVESYSILPFVSGADLIFENCLIDYQTDRGSNLMDMDMKSVEFYNCKLQLNENTTLGIWAASEVKYNKTTSPKCIMVNSVIEKKVNTKKLPLFGFIKNDNYTPFVLFSNVTTINCESKGGNRVGEITYLNAEKDYNSYNNVINVVIS